MPNKMKNDAVTIEFLLDDEGVDYERVEVEETDVMGEERDVITVELSDPFSDDSITKVHHLLELGGYGPPLLDQLENGNYLIQGVDH